MELQIVYDKARDGEYKAPEGVGLSEPLSGLPSGTLSGNTIPDPATAVKAAIKGYYEQQENEAASPRSPSDEKRSHGAPTASENNITNADESVKVNDTLRSWNP